MTTELVKFESDEKRLRLDPSRLGMQSGFAAAAAKLIREGQKELLTPHPHYFRFKNEWHRIRIIRIVEGAEVSWALAVDDDGEQWAVFL